MEMNRYLIAALYVMAGCVVAVPLKAQGNTEPLRGDRYRLIITSTVKVLSHYVENEENEHLTFSLSPDFNWPAESFYCEIAVPCPAWTTKKISTPYYTSNRIRAPGLN